MVSHVSRGCVLAYEHIVDCFANITERYQTFSGVVVKPNTGLAVKTSNGAGWHVGLFSYRYRYYPLRKRIQRPNRSHRYPYKRAYIAALPEEAIKKAKADAPQGLFHLIRLKRHQFQELSGSCPIVLSQRTPYSITGPL